MIDLTILIPTDAGRGVVYNGNAGEEEYGIISSWNETWVFVRYVNADKKFGETAQATDPTQLSFIL